MVDVDIDIDIERDRLSMNENEMHQLRRGFGLLCFSLAFIVWSGVAGGASAGSYEFLRTI